MEVSYVPIHRTSVNASLISLLKSGAKIHKIIHIQKSFSPMSEKVRTFAAFNKPPACGGNL